jgi:23S rRNA (cytidine1920-2'-O)/16S rRNA (cytidine1409-2'-O)-methyltransferase
MARQRADVTLVERGVFPSRERARAAIMAGEVRLDGQPLRKAGEMIDPDASFEVAAVPEYVSRGGHKLAGALDRFGIDTADARALDVGASTGGFTDCLLQRGASHVTALDVGYGQLAWRLRQDERVRVLERTNIRSIGADALGAPFDVIVVDVSFISLSKVLPHIVPLLAGEGDLLTLVKPQFEVGKGRVGKKGVVRDRAAHEDVLRSAVHAAHEHGLVVRGLTWSPLKGPEGNIEFWLWAARGGNAAAADPADVVAGAHAELGE